MSIALYEAYRATSNYVSSDGRIVEYSTGLKAGDPGDTPALKAVPSTLVQSGRWNWWPSQIGRASCSERV